jgi:hypothetical protein
MKCLVALLFFIFCSCIGFAQPLIHSHNDYQQAEPLTNALRYKVFSLEADVYLVNGQLLVAHDKKELATAPTLEALYLQPIIAMYKKHRGRISADTAYAPVLMIDVKQNGKAAIAALAKLVMPYREIFDRGINAMAVQLVISGDRGNIADWKNYPSFILFDGRPYENYDSVTMRRIGFISDAYSNYSKPADSTHYKLQRLAARVHAQHKLLRIWGTGDDAGWWKLQQQLGIDFINTDKVAACREFVDRLIR